MEESPEEAINEIIRHESPCVRGNRGGSFFYLLWKRSNVVLGFVAEKICRHEVRHVSPFQYGYLYR